MTCDDVEDLKRKEWDAHWKMRSRGILLMQLFLIVVWASMAYMTYYYASRNLRIAIPTFLVFLTALYLYVDEGRMQRWLFR